MKTVKLAWHFDFHSHKTVRIGYAPDFKGLAAELKRHGVEEIITFAKCHTGFSYYPTRFGTPHPRMKGDVFGGVVKACRAQKIKVLAYVSFGIDGEAGRRHHDWARVGKDGPHITPDHFISVCPFTRYTEELMLPQIAEIIRKYKPDGFWFDTMGALGVCYCEACRRDFRSNSGMDIPREPGDKGWGEYGRFRHKRGMALLKKVGDFIQKRLHGAVVAFNHIGDPSQPEKMPSSLTRLSLDPNTTVPHQSREMSFYAAYGAYADRPMDIMPTIFNQGWGDWSLASPMRLKQIAAAVWARGARLYMGDRLHPEGRLDASSKSALNILSDARAEAESEFPPDDASPSDDVLIMLSKNFVYSEDMSSYCIDVYGYLKPLEYAHYLVSDAGLSGGLTAECFLRRWIKNVQMIVLPNLPTIEKSTETILKSFVKDGGVLLAVGGIPRVEGKTMNWLGVSSDDKPLQDHIWLPSLTGGLPVLVRGPFCKLTLQGAKTLVSAIPPYDLKYGIRFGWGIGPVAGTKGTLPALTCRKIGKGTACYLEAPIFSDYAAGGNWQQIEWFRDITEKILPKARVRLRNSPGNVEMVVRRRGNETWIILVNHGGAETIGGSRSRVLAPLPAYSVIVEIRTNKAPASVICGKNKDADYEFSDSILRVPVILDRPWATVKIKWDKCLSRQEKIGEGYRKTCI